MKKLLLILLLLFTPLSFVFGDNIDDYGKIKNLELALEKRITDELKVYINSPFSVF